MEEEEEGTPTPTPTNNNAGESAAKKPAKSCAACKHQRRRCAEDCPLYPYFPTEKTAEFKAAHAVFGVKNITTILTRNSLPRNREIAFESLVWEANAWTADPTEGPLGLYRNLERENARLQNELQLAKRQRTTTNLYYQAPATTSLAYGGNNYLEGAGRPAWYQPNLHGQLISQGFYGHHDHDAAATSSNVLPVQNHVAAAGHGSSSSNVHPLEINGGRVGDSFHYNDNNNNNNNNLINGVLNNDFYNCNYNYGGSSSSNVHQMVQQQGDQNNCYGFAAINVQQLMLPMVSTTRPSSHHQNRGFQEEVIGQGVLVECKDSSTKEASKLSPDDHDQHQKFS